MVVLQVVRSGLLLDEFEIRNGRTVYAELRMLPLLARGGFEVDPFAFSIRRRRVLVGDFLLTQGDLEVAVATRPRPFRRYFEITTDTARYQLTVRGAWRRTFELRQDGDVIGTIAPRSWFGLRANVDLPYRLERHVQVFVTWLVLWSWRRRRWG